MATAGKQTVLIQGDPRRLICRDAALAGAQSCEIVLPKSLEGLGAGAPLRLPVETHRGGEKRLRLSLPRNAPPGRYAAEIRIEGKPLAATLEIEAAPRLIIVPARLNFEGAPGAAVEARFTLINEGNVAVTVPDVVTAGLYDDTGVENAFAETYRLETDDANELVGHWLRALRGGHGGLFKLQVAEGAGPLAVGAQRAGQLRGRLPDKLKPRHSYHGIATIGPLSFWLRVKVHK